MNQPITTKTIHRAIKFRAFPKKALIEKLNVYFIACAEIFNTLLDLNAEHFKECHCDLDGKVLASLAAQQARKYPISNKQAGYYVAPRLIYGLKRSRKEGEGELKRKEVGATKASFTVSISKPIFKYIRGGAKKRADFYIPLVGYVAIAKHRDFPLNARFKLCTVSRNPSGQYFVSLDYEMPVEDNCPPGRVKKPLGLDFSVPKLYVASDNTLVPNAEMLSIRKQLAPKISTLHHKLSHSKAGGKNYRKYRQQLAKVYQKIDNVRTDCIQKETRKIVKNYDFVGVETLSLDEMCERFRFYNAVRDDSWYRFVTVLRYKMESERKQLRAVNRYYPSSKTCHRCGFIKHDLLLSDREYICPKCSHHADRDLNAAKNIRDQALRDAGYKINYLPSTEVNDSAKAPIEPKQEPTSSPIPCPGVPKERLAKNPKTPPLAVKSPPRTSG